MSADPDIPSGLIADIYEAAVRDDGLGEMAESIGRFAGVEGAALIVLRANGAPETYSSPIIREQAHLYQAFYHQLDPWRPRGFVPGRDRLVLANELYPESDLIRTEFYGDFARPMGMFRPMSGYFDLGGGEMAAFGVEQPFATRLFEPSDKQRLAGLMPFLRRALLLRVQVRAVQHRSDLGFQALDALAIGVVVCGRGGRVVHANEAAATLADLGMAVGSPGERIRAPTEAETQRLAGLIEEAGREVAGSLRLVGRGGRSIVALATPLPGGPDGPGHVMVTFRPENEIPSPNVAVLRSLFGLSPVQADLCRSLAAGKTFDETAADRGVAVTTVRTHLAAVLARTGARNLRDLIRLLGAISPTV